MAEEKYKIVKSPIIEDAELSEVHYHNDIDQPKIDLGDLPVGTDHTTLTNIGTNTHAQIDTHIAATGTAVHGLGTMSTQGAGAVAITGGTIIGITDLAVLDGGTGASTTAGARTNLGLIIGTDVLAYSASVAFRTDKLSVFAATTSAELKTVISDETGTGALVFATSPALVTPTGIVKGDVGLGSVDNTADTAKPVSTAQQTALDLKANLASPTFTGTVTIPTPFTLGAVSVLPTGTELNFVDGVTSSIQTQLDVKITNPMTTQGDIIYGGASGVPTRLAKGTASQVLTMNAGATAPEWAAAAGGGAVATDAIWDAKGDLAVGTGANTAEKLTVGSNGQIAIADSGETTGLRYVSTLVDGWTDPDETWTYASASTFTVSGDVTAKYSKGTRLKFTQTSVKYGVVIASSYSAPNTTVTILTNTSYTIANAAISANYYSYQMSPQGYPGWFAATAPTFSVTYLDNGSGGQPTTSEHRVRLDGNNFKAYWRGSGTKAGTNATAMYITNASTVYPAATLTLLGLGGYAFITDNSTFTTPAIITNYSATIIYTSLAFNCTDNVAILGGMMIEYEI